MRVWGHIETDFVLGPTADLERERPAPGPLAPEHYTIPAKNANRENELEKALEVSRESEARLRNIIDTIPALAWCNLPDGSNEFVNQRWRDYTGLSSQEAYGDKWKVVFHPEDLPRWTAEWAAVGGVQSAEREVRLRRSDGTFHWFLLRVEVLWNEVAQSVVKWYGTATDIEDRKRIESLRSAEKRTLEMIGDGASLKEVLNDLCSSIDVEASPVISTVLLMDPDGERLWHIAGSGVPLNWLPAITPINVSAHAGCCGAAALLKERVIVSDVATDINWLDEYRELAINNGIRAAWSQPIIAGDGKVLGTFALYSSEPRVPLDAEIRLIEGAGHIALIAIERQQSREALKIALDEIGKSELRLRNIIDSIPTLAWRSAPDGSGEFWNKRWHDYTGLSPESIRGWGWESAIHPDDLKEIMDKWLGFLASGQPGEVEGRLRRFDGAYRWFLFRAHPFRDQFGNIVNWYGANIDIDDRKQAEEKLRQDEIELRQIVELIAQIIIVTDPAGTPLYANRVALDYLRISPAELPFVEFGGRLSHPEDVEKYGATRQAALARGLPFELEQRILGKDGSYRWFLFRYNELRNEQGKVLRWYITATDIHDRRQAEEKIQNENLVLREEIVRSSLFEEIVGSSEALRKILVQVSKVAPTDSTVLILGETGTGKELIARAIHNRSKRSTRAFIRVNCAAIPPSLIASELFGHEKGSFTGALQRRLGRFELADGGTLFLDEVGELPFETQVALLRVLQEREFERVGGNQTVSVDVRVLAATNRDLNTAVMAGMFRQDLYYRLNVFPIRLPALRERGDDIPLLVEYLIDRYARKAGKKIHSISKDTLSLFRQYHWPGNIRELQNVIERAVILCEGDTFQVDEAWLTVKGTGKSADDRAPLVANLAGREKEIIENALRESMGQISGPTGAAAKLGIARQTLESKIKKFRIDRYRFKTA
jgi:PAS domain S-box-containing protein